MLIVQLGSLGVPADGMLAKASGDEVDDANGAPILPGSSHSVMQKVFAMLVRYVRESRATMRFPGIFKLMYRYFDCSYNLREEDVSAKSMDSLKEWLAWLSSEQKRLS